MIECVVKFASEKKIALNERPREWITNEMKKLLPNEINYPKNGLKILKKLIVQPLKINGLK